jgi:hemoglobin-like flavoprotein
MLRDESHAASKDQSEQSPNKLEVPDTTRLEQLLAETKAAINLVPLPFVGSVAELVGYFGQQYINRQDKDFLEALLRGFEELNVKGETLSDSHWATFFQAVGAQRRTREGEVRQALANSVLNAASSPTANEDLHHRVVTLAADMTALHIQLLTFILHPERFFHTVADLQAVQAINPLRPDGMWEVVHESLPAASRRTLCSCASAN